MKRVLLLLAGASLLLATSDSRLTERERALHALDRLAFGARPGDVEHVLQVGVDAWIDQQLHPERIAERALDARLARYSTLRMSDVEIAQKYYAPILEARKEAKNAADPEAMKKELRARLTPDQQPRIVVAELQSQRILRAAESERQLNEVLVDFWMNHFNVFAGKGADRFLLTGYERDTIRPRIFGRFEDLLLATAKSPAMLFYLDNARSVAAPENRLAAQRTAERGGFGARGTSGGRNAFGARAGFGARPRPNGAAQPGQVQLQKGGLNENYARELMELHTLGVDGGYTQKDVTELARVLTGWSIERPQQGGGFVFRRQLHDSGAKTVLGIRIPAGGGMEEGERMISMLAHHPATAHHIAYKLSQRLVADEPPPALVDRVAKRFLATNGDLRETVKAIIDSPEFRDPRYYRAKVKSPFEYTISAVRALGATIDDPLPLARGLQQGGEPLYGAQAPTGYSDKAEAWVNTGALLNRINFALALADNKLPGIRSDVRTLIDPDAATDADRSVDALAQVLTGGALTTETRNTIKQRRSASLPTIAGLILGSPEFQRQ